MRILGIIDHPQLKITVFKMDSRLSLKLENSGYEQTFKLGNDERLASLEAVRQYVDGEFLEQALLNFQQMHRAHLMALGRAFPDNEVEAGFETII